MLGVVQRLSLMGGELRGLGEREEFTVFGSSLDAADSDVLQVYARLTCYLSTSFFVYRAPNQLGFYNGHTLPCIILISI